MKSKPTDDWVSLLSAEVKSREMRPSGPGWKTVEVIARESSRSPHSIKKQLRLLLQSGGVEMFAGTQEREGRLNNQVWYRIKKGKK